MTMSAIDSHHSPVLMVPATGFAEIISPFWRDEKISARAEMEPERRRQAEWDRRNVEDYVALLRFVA